MKTIQEEWHVKTPTLSDLKSRHVDPRELQAALVKLIELVNKNAEKANRAINSKANKEWRADL